MSDDNRPGFLRGENEEFSPVKLILTWSGVAVFLIIAIAWLFTPGK